MRFQLTHKLTTYLLVLAAMGTLGSAHLLTARAALLAVAFGALSWFFDPGTRLFAWVERAAPAVRLAATAFFGLAAYQVWRRLPEPDLTPVLNLVLFLIVYKLFQRAANRDYLQVYVLAFLMVLAGAAFAQSALFAVAFVVYVVVTTWTLILLHLRREMEENYLVKHSGHAPSHKVGVARILSSRRVVGGGFLGATGAVALVVCAGAALTFALVPRVGAGFALGGPRARKSLVGFSDEVTLGTSGFLSPEDETVALRAVVPRLDRLRADADREAAVDQLYWRGTVYETYQQGRWLRAHRESLRTRIDETGGPARISEPHTTPRNAPWPALGGADRQEIDIVGVSTPVAFALDHAVAFELPAPRFGTFADLRLVPRWSGEVAFQNMGADGRAGDPTAELHTFTGAHYVAYSRDPFAAATATPGLPLEQIPAAVMAPYLALPPTLSPRVAALARAITAGRATALGKVRAVSEWLDATHGYSLDLGLRPDGQDPVEDFLFDQKRGTCEYFASAAALLLRAAGLPTRYVNGFLGGEWNAVGRYVTVRQNRAHSWVEAYLGPAGWTRVDATPPVLPSRPTGRVRQLLDSMEFFWNRWVVGYDLGRQMDLAHDLERGVGLASGAPAAGPTFTFRWRRLGATGVTAAALVLGWLARRRRRRAQRPDGASPALTSSAVGRLYRRSLERLAQRNHARRPAETPRELALRVQGAELEGAGAFGELTELYLRARFGRKEVDEEEVVQLGRRLGRLGLPRAARAAEGAL